MKLLNGWYAYFGRSFSTTHSQTMCFFLPDRSVQPTAKVEAFDPLCEVQSDKASVEITSPYDGVIKELLVQEGEVAKVGSGLCLIEVEEEVADDVDSFAVEPPELPTQAQRTISPSGGSSPNIGSGEAGVPASRSVHPLDPNYTQMARHVHEKNVLAAPSVRHFARQNGVDLSQLMPGSGNGGRVEKRDVEAFLTRASKSVSTVSTQQPVAEAEKDMVVELGRTRYGMWKAMVKVRTFFFLLVGHTNEAIIPELGNPSLWVHFFSTATLSD